MRRQTLGPMSGSTLNSRASLGRPSLGGRKASLGKQSTNIQLPVSALLWQCSRLPYVMFEFARFTGAPRMSMGAAPATEENRYPMDETPAPSARRSSVAR